MAEAIANSRLYFTLLAAGLRSELPYRVNFVTAIVMGLVYQTTGFVFIWVVLARFHWLAGWSFGEISFLYGLRLLAHGCSVVAFGYLHRFETMVIQGDFDRCLIRPVSPLLQVLTARFPIGAVGDLVGGIAVFSLSLTLITVGWNAGLIVYFLLALVGAALLEAALKLAIAALSFRALSTRSVVALVDDVFGTFGSYPTTIFGGVGQVLLTYVLPVAFVAYLPAAWILGRTGELGFPPALALAAPLVGPTLFVSATYLWIRESREYQSVGH